MGSSRLFYFLLVMRYLVGFLLLLCSFAATAQKATVAFLPGNWSQVQVRAGQENRSVFLYIWSPSCGPCVEMARDVFPDTTVARYYNATFLSYKVNLDEGAGKELGTRYGITSLPTYLYFDSKGKLLHRSGGGKSAVEFIQDGKDAFDPSKAFFTLRERYQAGDRTAAFLYAFSAAPGLAQESDLHDQVVRDYLKTQNAVELTSRKNLEYLFNQYAEFNSPATQYFLAHQPAFAAQFGQEAVTKRTRGIISQKAAATGRKNDLPGLAHLRQTIARLLPTEAAQWQALSQIHYYLGQPARNWPAYVNATLAYGRKYAARDSFTPYEAAVYLTAFVNDKVLLAKGDQIIKQAIAADNSYLNLLTRAKLLHKLGAEPQAAAAANAAIAVATKGGKSIDDATELLADIRK